MFSRRRNLKDYFTKDKCQELSEHAATHAVGDLGKDLFKKIAGNEYEDVTGESFSDEEDDILDDAGNEADGMGEDVEEGLDDGGDDVEEGADGLFSSFGDAGDDEEELGADALDFDDF